MSRIYNRRSIRLKHYDYRQTGAYFITICSHERGCVFGEVVNGEMVLNEYGKIVRNEWEITSRIRQNIEIDVFQVMPNHFHAIISINAVGAYCNTPLHHVPFRSPSNNVGAIVRGFKSAVTARINTIRKTPGVSVWQRNYYEHVIRDEGSLLMVRKYISNNPISWETDECNPKRFLRA